MIETLEQFLATSAGVIVLVWLLLTILVESVLSIRRGIKIYTRERAASVSIALMGPFLFANIFNTLLFNMAFIYVYQKYAVFSLPLNKWWTWVLFFLCTDLCTYITHYMEHRVRFFWCSHEVHHSVRHLSVEASVRTSPVAVLYAFAIKMVLPLIGFHPILHHVEGAVYVIFNALNHNTHLGKLKPADLLLNTASNHRVHHSSDVENLDRNFGSYFMFWDHLFGTYRAEDVRRPLKYGLVKNRDTNNPFLLVARPYIELWRDIRNANGIIDKLKYIFMPPGWNPRPELDTRAETLQKAELSSQEESSSVNGLQNDLEVSIKNGESLPMSQ